MKIDRNKYKDFLVTLWPGLSFGAISQTITPLLRKHARRIIICRGRRLNLQERRDLDLHRLATTERDGPIYGNRRALAQFPLLITRGCDDNIQESVNVTLFYTDTSTSLTYVVLIKPRHGDTLVNPSGAKTIADSGNIQVTASREVKEETCLTLMQSEFKPLAKWTSDTCFAGIQTITHTDGLFCETKGCLSDFVRLNGFEQKSLLRGFCLSPTQKSLLDRTEVDDLYFLDVKSLLRERSRKIPNISPFHLLLIKQALHSRLKWGILQKEIPRGIKHIRMFEWAANL